MEGHLNNPEQNTPIEKEELSEISKSAPTGAEAPKVSESPAPREERAPMGQRPYQRHPRFGGAQQQQKMGQRRFFKKKFCTFCTSDAREVDYKDSRFLRRFVTERGKILPRRITGVCAFHQRKLSEAIKRARAIALLPFKAD